MKIYKYCNTGGYGSFEEGFITCWSNMKIEELAFVYSQAWNDAARSYKSF